MRNYYTNLIVASNSKRAKLTFSAQEVVDFCTGNILNNESDSGSNLSGMSSHQELELVGEFLKESDSSDEARYINLFAR